MSHKIRIFIAGSKLLNKEREFVRIAASKIQTRTNTIIDVKSYDDFNEIFTPDGAQSDYYDKYITSTTDIIIFILNEEVGGITKHEFDVAFDSFKKNKKPRICVYYKYSNNNVNNTEIHNIVNKISSVRQYYKDYTNSNELPKLIETMLLYETIKSPQPKISIINILKYICLCTIIGLIPSYFIYNDEIHELFIKQPTKPTIIPINYQVKVAPAGYFDIEKWYSEGMSCVCKNNLWGFINKNREIIIPLVFEDVMAFNEGFAQVKYNGKWGFIDKTGRFIVEPIYESVSKFVNGYAGIEINGKFGFINKTGKIVIQPIYDDVWAFSNGKAKVWKDGDSYFINTSGIKIEE